MTVILLTFYEKREKKERGSNGREEEEVAL